MERKDVERKREKTMEREAKTREKERGVKRGYQKRRQRLEDKKDSKTQILTIFQGSLPYTCGLNNRPLQDKAPIDV